MLLSQVESNNNNSSLPPSPNHIQVHSSKTSLMQFIRFKNIIINILRRVPFLFTHEFNVHVKIINCKLKSNLVGLYGFVYPPHYIVFQLTVDLNLKY